MLIDTLNLTEGSTSTNLIIPSGTQAARLALASPDNGELFYQTDGSIGLYVYDTSTWIKLANAADVTTLLNAYLKKDGSVELVGNLLPEMTGGSGNYSVRNLGSATQGFNEIYTKELFVSGSSLYVNGKKVIEDISATINFTTDEDQNLNVKTSGTGTLKLLSEDEINFNATGGIEATVPASQANKNITFENLSTNGDIAFTASGTGGQVQFVGQSGITFTGTATFNNTVAMSNQKITGLGTPTAATDAATRDYVDAVQTNVTSHVNSTSNPHSVTKTQVGLSNVTNDAQLKIASNLSDLNSVATARTNLGLIAGGTGDIWVEKAGDTMTGNLSLGGTGKVINAADPTQPQDVATKNYVDTVASGLLWLSPIDTANLIADNVTNLTTIGSPSVGDAYVLPSNTVHSGAAGWLVEYQPTAPRNGTVAVPGATGWYQVFDVAAELNGGHAGEKVRMGIALASPTSVTPSGTALTGRQGQLIELTKTGTVAIGNSTAGALGGGTGFDRTYTTPTSGQAMLSHFTTSFYYGNQYTFTGTYNQATHGTNGDNKWVAFGGATAVQAGTGLSYSGNLLNVNLGAGIVENPSDEVGLDLYNVSSNPLILTTNGTTRSTATSAQLALLLDGDTLLAGANGLKVNSDKFVLYDNGKIGIGIATPRNKIHSHVTDSGSNFIQFTNSTTGSASGTVGMIYGINASEQGAMWNYHNASLVFGTNNTLALTINTSQDATFEHNVFSERLVLDKYNGTSNSEEILRIDSDDYGIRFVPQATALAYNSLTQTNDAVMYFTAGTQGTGGLVIGPWGASSTGIHMDGSGWTSIGTATHGTPLHVYHATNDVIATFESGDAWVGINLKDSTATGQITCTNGGMYITPNSSTTANNVSMISSGDVGTTLSINGDGSVSASSLSLKESSTTKSWSLVHRDGSWTIPNEFILTYYNGSGWTEYFKVNPNTNRITASNASIDVGNQKILGYGATGGINPRYTDGIGYWDADAFSFRSTNATVARFGINSDNSLSIYGTIMYTNGSQSSYGAISIQGSKNTWSGISFYDVNGNFCSTLMTRDDGFSGWYNTTENGWLSYTDGSGNFVATGNVTAYSDERLKENVSTIENALDKVSQLRGVEYTRKDTQERGIGVIAQEVEEIIPEVISSNIDGYKGVAYGNLVGLLIEAIKEQKEIVAKQQTQIEELTATVYNLLQKVK